MSLSDAGTANPTDRANDEERDHAAVSIGRFRRAPRHGSSWSLGIKAAMPLALSRYLALVFAVALGTGEAVINWGHWQYAPLWIVDYIIVGWLLWSFLKTRSGQHVQMLLSGWAFTVGVFYIALFASFDPENSASTDTNMVLLVLIGLMLGFWRAEGLHLCAVGGGITWRSAVGSRVCRC